MPKINSPSKIKSRGENDQILDYRKRAKNNNLFQYFNSVMKSHYRRFYDTTKQIDEIRILQHKDRIFYEFIRSGSIACDICKFLITM